MGPVAGGIEHLVAELLPDVMAAPGVERWFFLRYLDGDGPHMRLRLRTRDPARAREALQPSIDRVLAELPRIGPPLYRPAVGFGSRVPPAGATGAIRVVPGEYEPETEKFGTRGLAIAEELFQRSSELAVRVLTDERDGAYSRKTLVPCLMQSVADAFAATSGPRLWQGYATYWLSVCRAPRGYWWARFGEKAAELSSRGVAVVPEDAALPERARPLVSAWRRHAAEAARRYAACDGDAPAPSALSLAFNFAHLMNNRLGITPLEEAYYGVLLHDCAPAARA